MKIDNLAALLICMVFGLCADVADAQGSRALANHEETLSQIDDYGYVLSSSVWPEDFRAIPVCWENLTDNYVEQTELVRNSIDTTWARYSSLEFTGWGDCPREGFLGIRILIANEIPHVQGLGTNISGEKNGMVLNFAFELDKFRPCNIDATYYTLCVRSIAVHEFGHAIGLAHEHNRNDKADSCFKRRQGPDGDIELTEYDPDSVMNYCNPAYNNFGMLSYLDVVTIQKLYGAPTSDE